MPDETGPDSDKAKGERAIHVHGSNARININSTDGSINVVDSGTSGRSEARHLPLPADLALFDRIRTILNWGRMEWFSTWDFGGAFRRSLLDPLHEFEDMVGDPDSEFLDPELEVTRAALMESVQEFTLFIMQDTFVHEGNTELQTLSSSWSEESRERARIRLNKQAREVMTAYRQMIRLGKARLHVA